ncbi:MAG: hypothetical protein JXP34_22275 [Planctomycetes bacterium]|nr:hypothetical protein [Planctomycetota bacterium]
MEKTLAWTRCAGRANVETHASFCTRCGFFGGLLRYETRRWLAFLGIPILPLAKVKVIDECPQCGRRDTMPLEEWSRREKRAIERGMAEVLRHPDDAEAATRLLGALVRFRRWDEAAELARILTERFADRIEALVALGSYHLAGGRLDEAGGCFGRAIEIDSGDVDARQGAALVRIRRGAIREAEALLEPGEAHRPEPEAFAYAALGRAQQDRGDQADALASFRRALRRAPQLAEAGDIRRCVRAAERSTGAPRTLPGGKRRRAAVWAVVIAILAAGAGVAFFLADRHFRAHQTVRIINALRVPIQVAIDGGEKVSAGSLRSRDIDLAEGKHVAIVHAEGLPEERIEFEIRNSLSQRFKKNSVFILNPYGAGVVSHGTARYVENAKDAVPPERRFSFGERFLTFRRIDYKFVEPAETIWIEEGARASRTFILAVILPPAEIIDRFPEATPAETVLRFCELRLRLEPDDEDLVGTYAMLAVHVQSSARGLAFLEEGLDRRPVNVHWHESYQALHIAGGDEDALDARYAAMLETEPGDAALLYLRGRLLPDGREAMALYDRAIAADPAAPHPWACKGFLLAARGDFAGAEAAYEKAVALRPGEEGWAAELRDMRFALGEYEGLEKDLRALLEEQPANLGLQCGLLAVLFARKQEAEAADLHDRYCGEVRAAFDREDPLRFCVLSRLALLALEGNWTDIAEIAGKMPAPHFVFLAHLSAGRLDDAERCLGASPELEGTPSLWLLLSLGHRLANAGGPEKTAFAKACELYGGSTRVGRRIAAFLRAPEPPSLDDLDALAADPDEKAIVLTALAARHEAKRDACLARARALNYGLFMPHAFLERAIDALSREGR